MRIFNKTQNTTIADGAVIAETFFARIQGLIPREDLPSGEALVITGCKSIHMFFMRFAIDAIFVDKHNCVVGLVEAIRPFRLSPIFLKSSYVIEVPVGTIKESKTKMGDKLEWGGGRIEAKL